MLAQSFLFLGGLQINYRLTLFVMLGWFAVESSADSVRVLIAVSEAQSLKELIVFSSATRSQLRNPTTTLEPHNVYEDMGHSRVVLWLVFLTQAILIAFVVSCCESCSKSTGKCETSGELTSFIKLSFRRWPMCSEAMQLHVRMVPGHVHCFQHWLLGYFIFLVFSWRPCF